MFYNYNYILREQKQVRYLLIPVSEMIVYMEI